MDVGSCVAGVSHVPEDQFQPRRARPIDEEVARSVGEMLEPLRHAMAEAREAGLGDTAPAFCFDPVRAAGGESPATPWDTPGGPAAEPAPRSEADLTALSAAELAAEIRRGGISPADVLAAHLARIRAVDGGLHAFLTVVPADGAMLSDGPLRGVPFGVKDMVETAGIRTTGGSKVRDQYVPDGDAVVVRRLRAAGGVLLGKLNTHEFAAGGTGENQAFGSARNPWDPSRVPGGSSSGSAVAVA
ncbi:MAG: amidase family protein, partial [Chloroflexota bacterium]